MFTESLARKKYEAFPVHPEELVEPLKELITLALEKVRKGKVDSGVQKVALYNFETHRFYLITDPKVLVKGSFLKKEVVSVDTKTQSMLIEGFQYNDGPFDPKKCYRLENYYVPRNVGMVTVELINESEEVSSQRLEEILRLAREIKEAKIANIGDYKELSRGIGGYTEDKL